MNTSRVEFEVPDAVRVRVGDDTVTVDLKDGRTISVPTAWYPRLLHGSAPERRNWRLIGAGRGIHWEDLDEDISVEDLLAGRPSRESAASLETRLQSRGS